MLKQEQVGAYPSSLTDEQWEIIKDLLPLPSGRGRRRSVSLRSIVDAILYVVRTGCAWDHLPKDLPNRNTVYDYFRKWIRIGLFTMIMEKIFVNLRCSMGREPSPSAIVIDSQATKAQFGEARGFDGFKKVRGRKRNLVVDTNGLPLAVLVDEASIKDHKSCEKLFRASKILPRLTRTKTLHADGGYRSAVYFIEKLVGINLVLRNSKHVKDAKGSRILIESNLGPIRWVVERSFAWLNHFRRLSRDYERTTKSSQAMVEAAFIVLMLNRLTRKRPAKRWK